MTSENALDILKKAILLEKRGHAFYSQVAADTESGAMREFFEQMAAEEITHIQYLTQQFLALQKEGKFSPADLPTTSANEASGAILTKRIQSQISAAAFESAAITAAIAMEKSAVDFYGRRAQAATDNEEIKLYSWLKDWENGHVRMLMEIDRGLTESIWNDQNFWPF